MALPSADEIRKSLLETLAKLAGTNNAGNFEHAHVLHTITDRIPRHERTPEFDRMALTQWNELFRTGYLGLGWNLDNPGHAWFHVTDRGMRAFKNLSRDPANPAGYKQYISSVAVLNPVAASYLTEGLDCFSAGHFKAAAVMIGAASESLILELRDAVLTGLSSRGQIVPKALNDWRVKTVFDGLRAVLDGHKSGLAKDHRDDYEAYWSAFTHQIRITRNDAGHPTSVDPVTEDAVHQLFLMFPTLARLSQELCDFSSKGFK